MGVGAEVGANLWRTTGDISGELRPDEPDRTQQAGLAKFAGPGHWNDPDMLEVGNGRLTLDENQTHMTLWAMLAAPLIAGNNLTEMKPEIAAILMNKEAIAIDQDALGEQGDRVYADGPVEIWAKPLKNGAKAAVAIFNFGEIAERDAEGRAAPEGDGIAGAVTARDVWAGRIWGRSTDDVQGDDSKAWSGSAGGAVGSCRLQVVSCWLRGIVQVGLHDVEESFGQQRRVVEAGGAVEAEAEGAGALGEGDVDVVEDLDVVREEADGLEDDCGVAFGGDGGEGVFDGGADPGATGDALALEGEEPFFQVGRRRAAEAKTSSAVRLASTGYGSGVGLDSLDWMVRQGTEWAVKRMGSGDSGSIAHSAQACGISVDEALGEGLDEGGLFGPGFDEGEGGFRRRRDSGGFGLERGGEGAAVEAGAGAGVLRSEAEGEDAGDAVGEHLADYVGDEGVPVAHGGVDRRGWPAAARADSSRRAWAKSSG